GGGRWSCRAWDLNTYGAAEANGISGGGEPPPRPPPESPNSREKPPLEPDPLRAGPLELELVAQPPHGLHVFRAAGILLDLGPQPLDVDVERAGVTEILDPPHLGEQDLARHQLARPEHEGLQEGELLGRQLDQPPPHVHLVALS